MSHTAHRCALGVLICISSIAFTKAARADVFFHADSLEKECLVWIVYYEGAEANEPHDGLAAIAQTVVNRQEAAAQDAALKKRFGGDTFCALMAARKQFSFMLQSFGLRDVCQSAVVSKMTKGGRYCKKKQRAVRPVIRELPHGNSLARALAAVNEVLEGVWQPVALFLNASKDRFLNYMNPAFSGEHACVFRNEFPYAGRFPGSAHEFYTLPTPEEQALLNRTRGCKRIPAL